MGSQVGIYAAEVGTYVLENSLHQSNSDFRLLDKVVFGVLDFNTSGLLLRRARVLQPAQQHYGQTSAVLTDWYARLLSSIQLQPTNPHRLPRLQRNINARIQRLLPGRQEPRLNSLILHHPRLRDLLPRRRILAHRLRELVVLSAWGALEGGSGVGRGAAEGVRERLVLVGDGGGGRGRREVGAFEVGGGEVGDAVPDGGA